MSLVDARTWDEFIQPNDEVHILQTTGWGQLKSGFGWEAEHFIRDRVGAQVLFRKLPLGYRIAYVPKGPVGAPEDFGGFFPPLIEYCRSKNAIFLKVEPDGWTGEITLPEMPASIPVEKGKPVQPRRTMVLDLNSSAEDILARMKQKTRYNIRLAGRKGIEVKSSEDIDAFYRLMDVTADRDEFGVHSKEYYQRVLDVFRPDGKVNLLMAYFEGQPLAAIVVLLNGNRAWYFYGASSNQHRNKMPTYLLQWEGIRWAKDNGAQLYDLWGIPDQDFDTLEEEFTQRSDGLWGVYRFKRGFGGEVRRSAAPQDIVLQPLVYQGYKQLDRMFFR